MLPDWAAGLNPETTWTDSPCSKPPPAPAGRLSFVFRPLCDRWKAAPPTFPDTAGASMSAPEQTATRVLLVEPDPEEAQSLLRVLDAHAGPSVDLLHVRTLAEALLR